MRVQGAVRSGVWPPGSSLRLAPSPNSVKNRAISVAQVPMDSATQECRVCGILAQTGCKNLVAAVGVLEGKPDSRSLAGEVGGAAQYLGCGQLIAEAREVAWEASAVVVGVEHGGQADGTNGTGAVEGASVVSLSREVLIANCQPDSERDARDEQPSPCLALAIHWSWWCEYRGPWSSGLTRHG